MKIIDGSRGEGGGQILRTALGLSMVTGMAVEVVNIRAGRKKPGLMRQHLTAVLAARDVCGAEVSGAEIGSTRLCFSPGQVHFIEGSFSVGTAGSCTLVLQTVLPGLLHAGQPFRLVLEGGTHNPAAPPYEFLERSFLRALGRMGVRSTCRLERAGFFPAGGGRMVVEMTPPSRLTPTSWLERGNVVRRSARALIAKLPAHIGTRELEALSTFLSLAPEECEVVEMDHSPGPGNALQLELETDVHTTVFTAFGQRDVSGREVARLLAEGAKPYLAHDVPIDAYLADQLLLPMALAGSGEFRTTPLTCHSLTNMETIREMLGVEFIVETEKSRVARVRVAG